jgi:hypothetical protein
LHTYHPGSYYEEKVQDLPYRCRFRP